MTKFRSRYYRRFALLPDHQINSTSLPSLAQLKMAGRGSVIMFGLFCCLVAIWETASGQFVYRIDRPSVYMRGLYEMIKAERIWMPIPFLEKLNSAGSPNQQLEILKKIRQDNPEGHEDNYKLDGLIGLAKDDRRLTSLQLILFLVLNQDPLKPEFLTLKNYVNHFALSKFSNFLNSNDMDLPPIDLEKQFDHLIRNLYQLPADADDLQLYDKLRNINLSRDELSSLRIKSMVSADNTTMPFGTSIFVSKLCEEWNSTFSKIVQPIMLSIMLQYVSEENMNSTLVLKREGKARLLKLVKYENLCW
jgi:hypothetical protein